MPESSRLAPRVAGLRDLAPRRLGRVMRATDAAATRCVEARILSCFRAAVESRGTSVGPIATRGAARAPAARGMARAIDGHSMSALSQSAVEIARPFGFPITNSMVVTWIVAIALIAFAQMATRQMTQVPGGAQNFLEWMVESLYRLSREHPWSRTWCSGRSGSSPASSSSSWPPTGSACFLASAPSAGATGRRTDSKSISRSFAAPTPISNLTLAMALVFFACWIVWAVQEVGVRGIAARAVRAEGRNHRRLRLLMIVVFFAAGVLEVVSILFRPVSLSFRLYGNIFAGENMLEAMATIVPGARMAAPGAVLFPGAAGGIGAGDGVHAAHRRLHAPHLPARGAADGPPRPDSDDARVRSNRRDSGKDKNDRKLARRLAALGAAIGVGLIGRAASVAVGRNPGASTKIMVQSILAIAFAEAIVFYALFLVR